MAGSAEPLLKHASFNLGLHDDEDHAHVEQQHAAVVEGAYLWEHCDDAPAAVSRAIYARINPSGDAPRRLV